MLFSVVTEGELELSFWIQSSPSNEMTGAKVHRQNGNLSKGVPELVSLSQLSDRILIDILPYKVFLSRKSVHILCYYKLN